MHNMVASKMSSRNNRLMQHILFVCCMVLCFSNVAALVVLHKSANSQGITLRSLEYNNTTYISIQSFCSAMRFPFSSGSIPNSRSIYCGSDSLIILMNAAWYWQSDTVRQMRVKPIVRGDTLFIAAGEIPEVFSQSSDKKWYWIQSQKKLYFGYIPSDSISLKCVLESKLDSSAVVLPHNDGLVITKAKGITIKTIVLDPGHGGKDPGAIGPNGIKEKDVVLPLALQIRDALSAKGGFKVFLTRETDVFIPLRQRTKFANNKKADLFISIHANSVSGADRQKEAKGYKTYFLSQAKNEEDKLIAMRENSVVDMETDTDKGNDLQNILVNLAGNEYLVESEDLSILIAQRFGKTLPTTPSLNKGVGQANFWVLNGSYMPSVLIEIGFISHQEEEKMLADKEYQKKLAGTIADAVTIFRTKLEGN